MGTSQSYPPDLSDAQWAVIEPLVPPVRFGGQPEKHPCRAIVDAIFYVVRTGCLWRQLPYDYPTWPTLFWYFKAVARRRHHRPVVRRAAQPAA